jgi:glycosyltransferase involved in cell wall biosynthesis
MTHQALYFCYFGLDEPLVQTQVVPYLRCLAKEGIEITLITFEREGPLGRRIYEDRFESFALRYHKRPTLPATLYDILAGAWLGIRLSRPRRFDILHARGHVPAAMAAIVKLIAGGRLLFDIRGLMPEEYVDAGVWPQGGFLYRLTKSAERLLMRAADGFVVLTEEARRRLFPGRLDTDESSRPIDVIPCCVDAARFENIESKEELRRDLRFEGRRVIIYIGALGGWYLTDEMVSFLRLAHDDDPSVLPVVLTQSDGEMIAKRLRMSGISDYRVLKVAPAEVPRYLKAADFAVSFIKPCYSKLASSPTKVAEYLAAGIPVVCNTGIGDLDEIIEREQVGVMVKELNPCGYKQALEGIERLIEGPDLAARCRTAASRRFDLEHVGAFRYGRLYRRLLSEEHQPALYASTAE